MEIGMRLEKPSNRHEQAYKELVNAWKAKHMPIPRLLPDDYTYFEEVLNRYAKWEAADIPSSVYLLLNLQQPLGVVCIRHRLDDFYKEFGGHLSYALRPELHEKGLEDVMLPLCREKAVQDIGIRLMQITCSPDNKHLTTAIVRNGGLLYGEGEKGEIPYLNYRIDLDKPLRKE